MLDRFIARQEVAACDLPDGSALLDMRVGIYYGLNSVASSSWNWLSKPRTISELAVLVSQEFSVEAACCERDIEHLISEMLRVDLVEVVKEPETGENRSSGI